VAKKGGSYSVIKEQNFWLTTVEMPAADGSRALPETADVAVIGAGFTGLSAARVLAKVGAKVTVLEGETIGWGASSRNGGMVLPGLKLGVNQLISMYGRERTQRMYAASVASIDCVERIVREENIACDFARCGHLEVACKQAHFDDYARQVEVIRREFNHELKIVPRSELRSEIGSDIYYGGMVDEGSVGLNPARYVAGLYGIRDCTAGFRAIRASILRQIDFSALHGRHGNLGRPQRHLARGRRRCAARGVR